MAGRGISRPSKTKLQGYMRATRSQPVGLLLFEVSEGALSVGSRFSLMR